MFMGEYNHTIDAKGRMIVPSKFREQTWKRVCCNKKDWMDVCLYIQMKNGTILKKNLEMSHLPQKMQENSHVSSSPEQTTCELDKQGRILIPPVLREFADLQKDVVSVGVLNRIEIWSKDNWLDCNSYDDMDEIAEHMADLGLSI